MQNDNESKLVLIFLFYVLFGFINTVALYFSPISQIAIYLTENKINILLYCFLIWVIAFSPLIYHILFSKQNVKDILPSKFVNYIIIYCALITLATGGIAHSPFSPEVIMVPLLAGPIYIIDERKKMLAFNLICIFSLGILSHFVYFQPPEKYPQLIAGNYSLWDNTGKYDYVIVTLILLFGMTLEIIRLNMNFLLSKFRPIETS